MLIMIMITFFSNDTVGQLYLLNISSFSLQEGLELMYVALK